METTTNYNLKKPDYTDFADIYDLNDDMDIIDEQLAAPTGDTADATATFTTSDTADGDASSWTNVPALTSGETHKSIFAKMSQMFKNLRYLYKLLGTTDISSIGNGTVTGGLSSLNDSLAVGIVHITIAANTRTSVPLTFPVAFPTAPKIVITVRQNQDNLGRFICSVSNITATGCMVHAENKSTIQSDIAIDWIAVCK